MPAQSGEQHLQLGVSAVLCLIDDDEGIVQGSAPHEPDRGNLDDPFGQHVLQLSGREPVGQCVVKRTQVRGKLVFHCAGQETDLLASFDRRARQNDPGDLALLQRLDRFADGKICLARPGRAECRDKRLVIHGLHQFGLVLGAGLDCFLVTLCATTFSTLMFLLRVGIVWMPASSAFYGLQLRAFAAGTLLEPDIRVHL